MLPCHPLSPPFCPSGVESGDSPDHCYNHDAMVASCLVSRRAQTTAVSEHHLVLFPSTSVTVVLPSQGGGGGHCAAMPCTALFFFQPFMPHLLTGALCRPCQLILVCATLPPTPSAKNNSGPVLLSLCPLVVHNQQLSPNVCLRAVRAKTRLRHCPIHCIVCC